MQYIIKDGKLIEHLKCESFWQTQMDGKESLYNCCDCGKQYRKLPTNKINLDK
jgi:hypothetical protein